MPIAPTYPGVYIEELPSGVHTITGVSTSVTAFLGYFKRGPMKNPSGLGVATQVFSMADVERNFGTLDPLSDAGYALSQFFANGGSEAWVVRVASGSPVASAIWLRDRTDATGVPVLEARAASPGSWGDNVRVEVDFVTTDPAHRFNLVVKELDASGRAVNNETFRNLMNDPKVSNYAVSVVNDGSQLIRLGPLGSPLATGRPAPTGTVSKDLTTLPPLLATDDMTVTVGVTSHGPFTLDTPLPATVGDLATALQKKIAPNAVVSIVGSASNQQFIKVIAGGKCSRLHRPSDRRSRDQAGARRRPRQGECPAVCARMANGRRRPSLAYVGLTPSCRTGNG